MIELDGVKNLKSYRIVIISSQSFSIINFRGPLIIKMVSMGASVFALAPDYDEKSRAAVSFLGAHPVDFRISRTGINPWRDVCNMFRLVILLRRLRPDVTLGYFIKPVIYGTIAAWMARVPRRIAMIEGLGYVFTSSDKILNWKRKFLRSAVSSLYKFALLMAHRVIFLNRDDIADFVGKGLVKKDKVVYLGAIGVDLVDWRYTPAFTKPITFLLVARLLREKGIYEYAAAAKLVKSLHPETRFLLLGGLDSNPGSIVLSELKEWLKEGLLDWPGHVDVKPWLAQTSVFVLPSYYREGVPRSTQEAMAMGRAVITTDMPGCRETVINGQNGYLIPARDAAALAQSMLQFINNPSLIESMGRESRKMSMERYDVHKINEHMLEILGMK